tara:strand:- start:1642 stop:3378 length:1737 start_codon:yes stop_codon:yes gene_type:complete
MMKIGEILDKREEKILLERRGQPNQLEIETHALAMAKKYNVPFDIIMRHMWIESRYKVRARSSKDAYGLMQLMPKTAKGLGVDRYDWKQNIEGGAKYLRNLYRRVDSRAAKATGAKGVKNKWEAVAVAYYSGGGGFNKVAREAAAGGYVDENGLIDWKRYSREKNRFVGRVRYADYVHDSSRRTWRRRSQRHPSYKVAVPKELISNIGLEKFGLSPTGPDSKTIPKPTDPPPSPTTPPKASPTVIYIGDSTTGGMSRHMKNTFKRNGINAHVFHVNGAGAALMHTMITGRHNRWSSKYDRAKRNKAMAIAAKIAKLREQGPVSIRIATLGGNDRFRVGSKKGFNAYVEDYVKPLFELVDEVGGSGRSKKYKNDLKNKAVDDRYRAAAEAAGIPYYSARGQAGKPQAFGSPWAADDKFPWRKKQSLTDYYRRQAEERIKFSSLKKNLELRSTPPSPDETPTPESPRGRFLRSHKSFLKKNPNFNFDNFYKDVETHLGSVAYAMPKHGSDYIFGPEHMRTWKALQKKKAEMPKPEETPEPTPTSSEPIQGPMTRERESELITKMLDDPPEVAPLKPLTTN